MAIASVVTMHPRPGREAELEGLIAEAKKMHEVMGARVRVWRAIEAGEAAGHIEFMIEFDDMTSYAKFWDARQANQDWRAFWARAFSRDPAGTYEGSRLMAEINL